jgi:NAD(P)-dependent dehydrogenase (short-subunit alcohol dehydrogenase family)
LSREREEKTGLSLFDLTNKKALVTGGSGGIGKACALGLARAGADVAIVDLKAELGDETVKEIQALGRNSLFISCDVSKIDQVENMVREVVKAFGRIDIAMNNAGIIVGTETPTISDDSLEYWRKTIDVDLNGVFYCCREEAKYMVPRREGKIINTASISASIANNYPNFGGGWVAYCTAKAGVKHLSRALAIELVQYNIRVNSISPGYVITPMSASVQENPVLLNHEELHTPMHRQANAEEMVGGVIYLASDASSYTTGHDLVMDGGYLSW